MLGKRRQTHSRPVENVSPVKGNSSSTGGYEKAGGLKGDQKRTLPRAMAI
jgi:hypothetical protein